MKRKSWITKKEITKILQEMNWDPYSPSLFKITQDLQDKDYYLKHSQVILQQHPDKQSIKTAIRLLVMAYKLEGEVDTSVRLGT